MNKRMTSLAAIAVALSLTAGCATRNRARPADPPTNTEITPNDGLGNDGTGQNDGPGSRADFLRSVPADRIFFDFDSYSVDAQDRTTLDAQAVWLARYPNVRVTIEGHADERGTREYNLALGERRANAAKNYLASLGIDASRIGTISYGKERPEAVGSDEASWAKNRRAVTVTVQ